MRYYENNVVGSLALFQAMTEAGIHRLVFSSSATVYGDPHSVPIREGFPLQATNPYGRSKLIIEDMLRDISHADPRWRVALLRYFNPVGAHSSGLIGEDPQGIPSNLMPYVSQVAVGRRPELSIFGGDYPTHDGTGIRDYIHVVDLARGHLAALNALDRLAGAVPINLGTGRGYSVLDVLGAFERASGRKVPYRIVERRPGDVATCYADPSVARGVLGWSAGMDMAKMCEDSWRWQSTNPEGFNA
jgi:UDP-glucose 4-epimerase